MRCRHLNWFQYPPYQAPLGRQHLERLGLDPHENAADGAHRSVEGRRRGVLKVFKKRMREASGVLNFERAAKYRDQIAQLRRVQEQQYVHASMGDVDVFALVDAATVCCVQALFIRAGRMLGQRTWFPKNDSRSCAIWARVGADCS